MTTSVPEKLATILSRDPQLESAVLASMAEFTPWLASSGMPFFPEYTDHGPAHVGSVLCTVAELISESAWPVITPGDAAVMALATLLHDCAMHMTRDSFVALVTGSEPQSLTAFDDREWPLLWQDFLAEAGRFSGRKLFALFGDTEPVHPPSLSADTLTGRDLKLIGEFLRRHHPRLAHEIAIRGVPGPERERLRLTGLSDDLLDLTGLVARSHGLALRRCLPYLSESFDLRSYKGVHAVFLMTLLRIADYVQIQAERAPRQRRLVARVRSPVSQLEWNVHGAIRNISFTTQDPEALLIQAHPPDVRSYLRLREWLSGIQHELDTSWAVLGEVYGRFPNEGLNQLGLGLRRVISDVDDTARLQQRLSYIPQRITLETAGVDLISLLIGPLYGDRPDVGIRELIQNAVDAVRELNELRRRRGIEDASGGDPSPCPVVVHIGQEQDGYWWLSVTDCGVGMTVDVIRHYFLKAGASLRGSDLWKQTFEDEVGRSRVLRSGRFGIGALAAFLLGERIEVRTRHIDEQGDGLTFSVGLDDDIIELRKGRSPVGTSIRVRLSNHSHEKLLSDLPSWDWYALTAPVVRRVVVGQVLPQEYALPLPDSELPVHWRRIRHPAFEDIHWTFTPAPALTCNGIVVKPRARDFVNVRFEPPRVYRRRVDLSYATKAGRSSEA